MEMVDLLGTDIDLQLIGKLTLTLAAIVLISWGYKFCSSRGWAQGWSFQDQSNGNGNFQHLTDSQTPAGTCIKCKADLRPNKAEIPEGMQREKTECNEKLSKDPHNGCPKHWEYPEEIFKTGIMETKNYAEDTLQDEAGEQCKSPPKNSRKETREQKEYPWSTREKEAVEHNKCHPDGFEIGTFKDHEYCPKFTSTGKQAEVHQRVPHFNYEGSKKQVANLSLHSTLPPLLSTEQGQLSPTGRRSPCTLRKLEQSAGVRRELRQNLGNPSSSSSFQSMVEIRVDDADFLLEVPGQKQVEMRGKIYDFYAESSSQSSDFQSGSDVLRPTARKYEDFSPKHSQHTGLAGTPAMEGDCRAGGKSMKQPVVPGAHYSPQIKQDGGVRESNPNSTATPLSTNLCLNPESPTNESLSIWEAKGRANFSSTPLESAVHPELTDLIDHLDLGNSLQALTLARKHRHASLEDSALKIMSDNYLQVLHDAKLYGTLKAEDQKEIQNRRMKGRQRLMVADIDSQDWMRDRPMSGSSDSGTSSALYYYDDDEDTWHCLCPLPKEVASRGCAMCTMDNYLFIALGCEGSGRNVEPSRKVLCFNPVTGAWKEICPMNEARHHCKLVPLLGHVYAIGGDGLRTVERYDPRANSWAFIAPLPRDTFAVAHRAAACSGELFVLGGAPRHVLLRYNPQTDSWRHSLITASKEGTTEMVAVRNSLYRFDVSPLQGIAVYRYHAAARLWYQCCSKRLPYPPAFQCATMGKVIFCVNREFTLRLLADEVSPTFDKMDLKALTVASGVLFPFTLVLPEMNSLQTSV